MEQLNLNEVSYNTDNTDCIKSFNLSENKINLIINADDLGICKERDEAIFELWDKKIISSSSILTNSVNFLPSIKKAKEKGLPLGLHLNLTEGEPIYKNKIELNSLVYFDENSKCHLMHGKMKFRELLAKGEIKENDIKNEIIHQILTFINHYNNIPYQIDGHQHIHVIPQISFVLAPIMSNYFGIYQTRFPNENLDLIEKNVTNENSKQFYKEVMEQTEKSKINFQNYNVSSTDYFIGMSLMGQNLTEESFKEALENIIAIKRKPSITVEFMCHPGYKPSKFYWDEFNCSQDRVHEKEILEKIIPVYKQKFNFVLSNFLNISNTNISNKKEDLNPSPFNILIIGDFTFGTGNSITAIRLQSILKNLNYNVYLQNIKFINNYNDDQSSELFLNLQMLQNFLLNKKINLIIGINLYRSGRVINLLRQTKNNLLKIPYVLICAGTDANTFINLPKEKEIIKTAVSDSELIISFNQEMINKIEDKLGLIKYEIIPQSVCVVNDPNSECCPSNFSIRKKLNIGEEFNITLFPAGIRKVKDPKFVLKELLELLEENPNHYVILIGTVYDLELQEEVRDIVKDNKRFILYDAIDHKDFISVLKESQLVINTSVSEGMSNVLMEAMKVGVPVIARENDGNKKLIHKEFNGLLFAKPEEFKNLYMKIYNEEEFRNKLIENAKILINEKYDICCEKEKYKFILKNIFDNYYKQLTIEDKTGNLIFLKNVHPFSDENNLIFDKAIINLQNISDTDKNFAEFTERKINLIDVGCGAGIFSFIFLLKNPHLKINELVLTDIDDNCLYSTYQNFLYNNNYFNIDKITIIKSDILNSLEKEQRYEKYFDIVLANMPQTPSINAIRRKKRI